MFVIFYKCAKRWNSPNSVSPLTL